MYIPIPFYKGDTVAIKYTFWDRYDDRRGLRGRVIDVGKDFMVTVRWSDGVTAKYTEDVLEKA